MKTKLNSPVKSKFAERFIHNRASCSVSSLEKFSEEPPLFPCEPNDSVAAYSLLLKSQLFAAKASLKHTGHARAKENESFTSCMAEQLYSPLKAQRKIPNNPYKVLDAPALQDDFYLNLIDWSSQNILSVGLGSSIYL